MFERFRLNNQAIVQHYVDALRIGNVDALLGNYTDETILLTPEGPVQGAMPLRMYFTRWVGILSDDFGERIEVVRQDVVGNTGYVVWRSAPEISWAVDTFQLRSGRIILHTLFWSHTPDR